jgi:Asp-tRNA(Asn)/Glu-tRNA(Gln) amidotransferase B subunit
LRFQEAYGLGAAEAALLTTEREVADTFEAVVGEDGGPERARSAANWIANDVMGLQKARGFRRRPCRSMSPSYAISSISSNRER